MSARTTVRKKDHKDRQFNQVIRIKNSRIAKMGGMAVVTRAAHWITGYAKVEISGDGSRFINMAAKSGIPLWGFEKKDGKLVVYVKARKYKQLRSISRRCGTRIRYTEKKGLPFYGYRLQKRKGLIAGAVLFVLLYFYMGSFVWSVSVEGTENITQAEVLEAAKACGIYEGAWKEGFHPKGAGQSIMLDVEGITWISVNTEGCDVTISIKEAEERPELETEEKPSNIVAEREGRILAIESQSGMQKVFIGDTVVKGQLLISGIYTDNSNPWIQKQDPLKTKIVASRGKVLAETVREFSAAVPAVKEKEIITGEMTFRYLRFFGLKIPLGFHLAPEEPYRVYLESDPLVVLDKKLPVGMEKEKYILTGTESAQLNEDDMKKEALRSLREIQKEELGENAKILKEELIYTIDDEGCTVKSVCRCEEEIGETQEILFEETTDG